MIQALFKSISQKAGSRSPWIVPCHAESNVNFCYGAMSLTGSPLSYPESNVMGLDGLILSWVEREIYGG